MSTTQLDNRDKTIIVCGGTGSIGIPLCSELSSKGFKVIVFTRDIQKAMKTGLSSLPKAIQFVEWKGQAVPQDVNVSQGAAVYCSGPSIQEWSLIQLMNGCYAVINLAGRSMYSTKRVTKKDIQANKLKKINVIRHLAYLMDHCDVKPKYFYQASSVEFYGKFKDSAAMDEAMSETSPHGCDFWGHGADILENETKAIAKLGVHVTLLRLGFVIAANCPWFQSTMERSEKGTTIYASGKQWVPWIHVEDVTGIIIFLLTHASAENAGESIQAINVVSPSQMRQEDFARILSEELKVKRPRVKMPEWYMKVSLGKPAGFLAKTRKIVPQKMIEEEYKFLFLSVQAAIRKEIGKKISQV